MLVQDQSRENQMIQMLGLIDMPRRLGHDAEDKSGHKFELKSTTKTSFSTGRDVSVNMINIWRKRYWIFAKGINYQDGFEIKSMYLCTPKMMNEQFDIFEKKFQFDIKLQDTVLEHTKKILNITQLSRLTYLINRGMTYNNPHIGLKYVREHGVEIDLKDPKNSLKKQITVHP